MRDLHFFIYESIGLEEVGIEESCLGIGTFPQWRQSQSDYHLDACHLDVDVLPGGSYPNHNKDGIIAIHEAGHWFGLLHTFHPNSAIVPQPVYAVCEGPNDGVDDTAPQYDPTSSDSCPLDKDSCPNQPGLDNVNNYMDYTGDDCADEFTPGQADRMHKMFRELREAPSVASSSG